MFVIGQIVRFVPKPSYGIRWSEDVLTVGYVARVTSAAGGRYAVQRRNVGDYPFHDAHWSCNADELREVAAATREP